MTSWAGKKGLDRTPILTATRLYPIPTNKVGGIEFHCTPPPKEML